LRSARADVYDVRRVTEARADDPRADTPRARAERRVEHVFTASFFIALVEIETELSKLEDLYKTAR
jgi:hypothetical protein